ncbi:SANT and BTB domain regulator of class switch recombination-like [Clavelina lepadiformis]|uniref:SANT and BTB domain-containing protein n=1 Tax=Clavelina lepadiformis TaxID=159417 RepID=A0ABP0FSW3_CLALP
MPGQNTLLKHRQSEEMIDALLRNFANLSTAASGFEVPHMTSDVIMKLVPDANPEYIAQRLVRMRTQGGVERNLRDNNPEDVHNYVYSLLQTDKKCDAKSTVNDVNKFQSSGCFQLDSHNTKLDIFQKGDSKADQAASPAMVIHVCDEAKNLKQDFDCPRDLLVQEMKYFAEYLSVDSQRLEEVDISVHCDIHIFDWLMRYVKRDTELIDEANVPRLDPNNVISILISSDFLKMESLVEACINYCHKNMSLIVATPCNMNCVNERLTSLIAAKFSHNELEEVKDRKDKFKSKLFCKKIEKLFDPNLSDCDSTGKASSLFKCFMCQHVLTSEQSFKLPCTNNRLGVNSHGGLSYEHEPDNTWDVNNFLICLFEELRKWSLVYWRLWGIINNLTCSRCNLTFQLCDFSTCMYHPERPQYQNSVGDTADNALGFYTCCNQHVLRFDPTGLNKGCRTKDHIVSTTDAEERRRLDDLLTHKNLIRSPSSVAACSSDLNIFSSEEVRCSIKEATMTPVEFNPPPPPPPASVTTSKRQGLARFRSSPDNGEEDVAGEEDVLLTKRSVLSGALDNSFQNSNIPPSFSSSSIASGETTSRNYALTKKKEKIKIPTDSTTYRKYPSKQRWDTARSIRWNQDMQREEDRRRLNSIASNLTKLRTGDKIKSKDQRELPGGIFMKLEQAFFNNLKAQSSGAFQGQMSSRQYGSGSKDFKAKLRR